MQFVFRFRNWILLVFLFSALSLSAQSRRTTSQKRDKNDDKPGFVQNLWWGGSFGLGGAAFSTGGGSFGVGIFPMLGYKITPFLSIGPRAGVFYTVYKPAPNIKPLNLFDFEAGGFLRAHIYRGFFAQGELSNSWQEVAFSTLSGYSKVSVSRANQLIGLGYNFGRGQGGVASELSIMYNLALANNVTTSELPIEYRFGFTWRF